MKKILLILFSLIVAISAFAQISDQAVISFIKKGVSDGKSQSQIATELMSKGVTVDQLRRVQKTYQEGGQSEDGYGRGQTSSESRMRTNSSKDSQKKDDKEKTTISLRDQMLKDKKIDDNLELKDMGEMGEMGEIGEMGEMQAPEDLNKRKKLISEDSDVSSVTAAVDSMNRYSILWNGRMMQVYGHNLFSNRELTFEPNVNMPTPSDYTLGPGDEVIIDVWGENEATVREEISPDGKIYVEQIGPIHLSGLTISQATVRLKETLSQKYSLSGPEPGSRMSVTLGEIRSVLVNVVGEVNRPGTYKMSSFSSVFNALYSAGGVTPIGSLRIIQVARGGKVVATADLYDYIINGSSSGDITLKDGDAIIVPPYSAMIEVGQGFKRPMLYEVIPGDVVGNVMKYAGGFVSNAGVSAVSVSRQNGHDGKVFSVEKPEFSSFVLSDGDILEGYLNETGTYVNRIEIRGSVLYPGVYALGDEIATVRQLVLKAGGLLEDSFTSRAQLVRERPDRSLEVAAVPLGAVMDGTAPDVLLRKNDILLVSNANELNPKGDITVSGYVMNPGDYEYAVGMSVEDIIMLAGGLKNGASCVNVEVARRIVSQDATEATQTLATIFTCRIKDGLMVDGEPAFTLEPYDMVDVRKDPVYQEQKKVTVSGEATFPGEYVLVSNNERISDIYKRAGGATPNGNVQGAMIKRKMNRDDMNVRETLVNAARNSVDSLDLLEMKSFFISTLGINLDKAIADPGGEYDVILRDGDELIIPQNTNAVGVQGEVLFPNMVSYLNGKTLKYYIAKAGGYSNDARRSKVFVVYQNGEADAGSQAVIRPGCTIYVPAKSRDKITVTEWMALGTTAASLTTMVATIANLIKK